MKQARPDIATLDQLTIPAGVVLVRADLNLPMHQGQIRDPFRLEQLLPTLRELSARQARIMVLSHFGRPAGRCNEDYSLAVLRPHISAALQQEVRFAGDCIGPGARELAATLAPGEVGLAENLRFHPGEEANDAVFAGALAEYGQVYVNDAFSCSHRAHASIVGLPGLLPCYGGRALINEITQLASAFDSSSRPLAAIVGGAKVSTKLAVLENLAARLDMLFIGGAMANTFLAAQGHEIGASLVEPDMIPIARRMLDNTEARARLHLPSDLVVAPHLSPDQNVQTCQANAIPASQMALDIGPDTVAQWEDLIASAPVIVWNGPLGAFETHPFHHGTQALARIVATRVQSGKLRCIAGGGDTVAALRQAGVLSELSYVSTAGGAFLEWLEGHDLPGISALSNHGE